MSFVTIVMSSLSWLPPWFLALFIVFLAILLALFIFKVVAFVMDILPFV